MITVTLPGPVASETAPGPWVPTGIFTSDDDPVAADEVSRADAYGSAVDIWEDTAAVGAPGEGLVHVLHREQTGWDQLARLDLGQDAFGSALALTADTLAVRSSSAVHIFTAQGTDWVESSRIPLEERPTGDPGTLALDETTLAVAAPDYGSDGGGTGAVLIYEEQPTGWAQKATLTHPETSCLGSQLVLSGGTVVAGDPCRERVHVFQEDGPDWRHAERLKAEGTDGFGAAIGFDEDAGTLAIGAPRTEEVVVYRRVGATWGQVARLEAADAYVGAEEREFFGAAVVVDGKSVIVGAPFDDRSPPTIDPPAAAEAPCGLLKPPGVNAVPPCPGPGAVYVYAAGPEGWIQTQKIVSDQNPWDSGFGSALAADGGSLLVGDPTRDIGYAQGVLRSTAGLETSHGTAYIYEAPLSTGLGQLEEGAA